MANPDWKPTAQDVADASHLATSDVGVGAAIEAATAVVTRVESASDSVTDGELQDMAKYLAAHIATVPNPQEEREKGASFSATFLRETTYGETAAILDPTGIIAGGGDTTATTLWTPDAKGTR